MGFAVIASIGLIVWQAKHGSAYAALTSLTPEDMTTIAEGLQPMQRLQLANSPDARKKFAEDVRQFLAVAEEAREKGVADRPEVKLQLEAMRTFVLAQMYIKKQRDANPNLKSEDIKPKQDEIDAFLKDPHNLAVADAYPELMKNLSGQAEDKPIPDAQKEQFRQQWAPFAILAQKAKAAGMENDRSTRLQLQIQEAIVLDRLYENDAAKKFKPTDQEVEAYYAAHPDLDPKAQRQKAEDVLKRARAGEDFAALAKQYSDDPGSKEKGGDLGWFGHGQMVKQFEDAAFALKDNQISDIIETPFGYHIIKVTGHRTDKGAEGKPEDQVQASHILFATGEKNPNPFQPPRSAREIAEDDIINQKTKAFEEEIAKRVKITVPDDFPVTKPEVPNALSPHGGMQAPPEGDAGEDEDEAGPPPAASPNANAGKTGNTGAKPKPAAPGKKK